MVTWHNGGLNDESQPPYDDQNEYRYPRDTGQPEAFDPNATQWIDPVHLHGYATERDRYGQPLSAPQVISHDQGELQRYDEDPDDARPYTDREQRRFERRSDRDYGREMKRRRKQGFCTSPTHGEQLHECGHGPQKRVGPFGVFIGGFLALLIAGGALATYFVWPVITSSREAATSVSDTVSAVGDSLQEGFKREKQVDVEQIVAGETYKAFKVQPVTQEMSIDTKYCEGLGFTAVDQNCTNQSGVGGWLKRTFDSKTAQIHMEGDVSYLYDLSNASAAIGDTPDSIVFTVPPPTVIVQPDFDKTKYGDTSSSLSSLFKDANAAEAFGQATEKMQASAEADTKLAEAARTGLEENLTGIYASANIDLKVKVVVAAS